MTGSGQQVSVRPRSVAALGLRLPDPIPTAQRGSCPDFLPLPFRRQLGGWDDTWSPTPKSSSEFWQRLLPGRRLPFLPKGSIRTCAFLPHQDSTLPGLQEHLHLRAAGLGAGLL